MSSAKGLSASHSNPMSNSFIFIMEIHVVHCLATSWIFRLLQGILKCNLSRGVLKDKKDDQAINVGVDFYFSAYVSEENLFHQVHDIHRKYFSSLHILFSI